jgi:hypothetical protein
MIEGLMIFLGFYLAMVKALKLTREIEERNTH